MNVSQAKLREYSQVCTYVLGEWSYRVPWKFWSTKLKFLGLHGFCMFTKLFNMKVKDGVIQIRIRGGMWDFSWNFLRRSACTTCHETCLPGTFMVCILGLWIDYDKIDYRSIIVMGDQLSPFSQLIGWSCDHHFVPLFWWEFIIAMSEEISNCRWIKGVDITALWVASYNVTNWKTWLIGCTRLM